MIGVEPVCAHFTYTGSPKPTEGQPWNACSQTMILTTNPIRIHLLGHNPEETRIHSSGIQPCSLAENMRNLRRIAIKSTPVDQMGVIETNERKKGWKRLPKTCAMSSGRAALAMGGKGGGWNGNRSPQACRNICGEAEPRGRAVIRKTSNLLFVLFHAFIAFFK